MYLLYDCFRTLHVLRRAGFDLVRPVFNAYCNRTVGNFVGSTGVRRFPLSVVSSVAISHCLSIVCAYMLEEACGSHYCSFAICCTSRSREVEHRNTSDKPRRLFFFGCSPTRLFAPVLIRVSLRCRPADTGVMTQTDCDSHVTDSVLMVA